MNWRRALFALGSSFTFLTTGTVDAGVLSGNCRIGNQPAATLLIPYFEVDLGKPGGATTLLSVNNASAKPAIARVVLWTDWGVPTLAFDVEEFDPLIMGQLPPRVPCKEERIRVCTVRVDVDSHLGGKRRIRRRVIIGDSFSASRLGGWTK